MTQLEIDRAEAEAIYQRLMMESNMAVILAMAPRAPQPEPPIWEDMVKILWPVAWRMLALWTAVSGIIWLIASP